VNIKHLDGSELIEHGPRGKASSKRSEPGAQCDVQAVGHEGDEDVSLDAFDSLMKDWAQFQIVLQIFESRLDFGELDIELPQLGRILCAQIGP
jgi:hypothetical protein